MHSQVRAKVDIHGTRFSQTLHTYCINALNNFPGGGCLPLPHCGGCLLKRCSELRSVAVAFGNGREMRPDERSALTSWNHFGSRYW